mmetsp:Transcript_2747/g.5821  ORF Transcript_2747/g.5821 Transcript_2747/m.5821 type:complete len:86 (+) Transcript_2747:2138-2395(+)
MNESSLHCDLLIVIFAGDKRGFPSKNHYSVKDCRQKHTRKTKQSIDVKFGWVRKEESNHIHNHSEKRIHGLLHTAHQTTNRWGYM